MKLILLLNLIPYMNKSHARNFQTAVSRILALSGNQSIFKLNVNPFRVGLILYHTISQIDLNYRVSIHQTMQLLDTLQA